MGQLLARARRAPVVLLLDRRVRVDEVARARRFRGLLREAVLTRLARVPMLAVAGRACFGGASLLACICARRHYLSGARLAASGPAVIEGSVGVGQFDAHDHASVEALMGSAARVQVDTDGFLVADAADDVGTAVRGWLRVPAAIGPGVRTRRTIPRARLLAAGGADATGKTPPSWRGWL
jgi:hypothetical protein